MTRQQKYMKAYYRKHQARLVREERHRRKVNGTVINRRRRTLYVGKKKKILARNKKWRDRNSAKVLMQKRLQRLRQMGLSKSELKKAEQALLNHRGKCQICGRKTPGGMGGWLGDHCHRTKKFRGVLCNRCNTLLGFAQDSIKVLSASIRYLRRHK